MANGAIEAISTLVNLSSYQKQIRMTEFKLKKELKKVEAISSSSKTKSYLQSSVDGNGTQFETYV